MLYVNSPCKIEIKIILTHGTVIIKTTTAAPVTKPATCTAAQCILNYNIKVQFFTLLSTIIIFM